MVINISVRYDGGLLPDIILLTQCYYHRGTQKQYIITTMLHDVLFIRCFCFVFAFCLVSLHGD